MKLKFIIIGLSAIFLIFNCQKQLEEKKEKDKNFEKEIIDTYLKNGAWKHHYLTKEWDEWINKALEKDTTIALLWQNKAIPFWKQGKYQLATEYYNKAVKLDRKKWLSRLGFLKCIFAKDYKSALIDLINYKKEFGSIYEQDHPLEFYMGICYLQLNQYEKALKVLQEDVINQEKDNGKDWVHFLDRFYLAITHYELGNYNNAITEFDAVLKEYPNFSDAQYYKSLSLNYLGKTELAKKLVYQGRTNFENGITISEDSSLYEVYPYQVTWQWNNIDSIFKF